MRNNIFGRTFVAIALFSVCVGSAVAQNFQEIRLKCTNPIGNFDRVGETDEMLVDDKIGSGAATGVSLGYRYSFDIGAGISFSVGADAMWNNTSSEYREACRSFLSDNNPPATPHYLNFPVSVGVALRTPLGKSNDWFAFFGACAGMNIHYTTSTGWTNFEVRYKPVLSPCLSLETGIKYRQFSLSIELMTLGAPTIKGSGEEAYHRFKTLDKTRDMLMGNIVFSYKLVKQKIEWNPTRKTILDM